MKLFEFDPSVEPSDQDESSTLLQRTNQTATPYPRTETVPRIFVERAAAAPDAVAVLQDDVQLSYRQLNEQSDLLARFLLDQGVDREDLIAIVLDHSPAVIVAMLGAMKSGGAYLPVSPDLPEERISMILRDSRAPVVVADPRGGHDWSRIRARCPDLRTVYFDDGADRRSGHPAAAPIDRSEPGTLAYVMYTSGTTGVPKGVMIEHRSILRLVLNTNYIQLTAADRILQTGATSFDASTFEVWGALLNGGSVYLPHRHSLLDVAEVKRLIGTYRITTMWLTAGLFNALVSEDATIFSGLKTVLCGGERLSPHHINSVRRASPGLVLINGYGPTENTTFTTTFPICNEATGEIPIGRPIANTTVFILDEHMEPVPPGAAGELYAGGDGLARGYVNDLALTAARFLPHPFLAGQRLYRTGDLARYQNDGTIEYLGRIDDQVKIRGYRIEPGEIETRLLRDGRLMEALVLARTSPTGDHQLVAYYRANTEVTGDELRNDLRHSLPDYMIPSFFVQVDQFPLTHNGKVDKVALPAPTPGPPAGGVKSPGGATATETVLIEIWSEVFGHAGIDVDSNFFDLGGHSLRAVKLMYLIRERLNVLLPFTIIFDAPTIRKLAHRIIDAVRFGDENIDQPLVALTRPGSRDLSLVGQADAPPLFAFPPGTADALGYAELARRLRPHGFSAFNFIEADTRIQDYAELVSRAGDDPYVLFGYSGGGNYAFRTAVELERRGKRVSDIIMLDSSRFLEPFRFPAGEAQRLALEFAGTDSVQAYIKSPALKDKVIRVIERYYESLSGTPDDAVTGANIHLVVSENSPDAFRDGDRMVCSKSAWARITSGVFRTYQGSGDHAHMLHRPHLERNATLLRDIFEYIADRYIADRHS